MFLTLEELESQAYVSNDASLRRAIQAVEEDPDTLDVAREQGYEQALSENKPSPNVSDLKDEIKDLQVRLSSKKSFLKELLQALHAKGKFDRTGWAHRVRMGAL